MRCLDAMVLGAAVLVSVRAALVTTTLPWADGNTLILSVSTDADGDAVTQTISTVSDGADDDATTTARTTRHTTATTTTADDTAPTTTGQRVVGQEDTTTTAAPMRTTTYWYENANGVWTTDVWIASVTVDPTVATAIVASGTIQDYEQYQQSADSVILNSAIASQGDSGTGVSAGMERLSSAAAGWTAMGVGMLGAMWAVMAM